MPLTLTRTAKMTKTGIVFFGLIFLVLASAYTAYQIYYYQYYLPNKPAPIQKPEEKFSALPAPSFITSAVSSSNYSYTLATVTGGLPTVPKNVKVYFIPQLGTTLLASDKAKSLASSFGFNNGPKVLSQTQFEFDDDTNGKMTINLDTSNFKFARVASTSATLSDSLPDQSKLASDFKDYLSSLGLMSDNLKNGRTKVVYNQADSQTSQTASISIWPADFDKLPLVTPTFSDGLVKAVINKSTDDVLKYQSLSYTYWSPDPNNGSTYPIKTPDQALADLKSGKGSIVIEPQNPQVAITSVYLAYFESDQYSLYLLPIYVFEGQGFVAYVNAISDEAVGK